MNTLTTEQFIRIMFRGTAIVVAIVMVGQLAIEATPVVNLLKGWLIDAVLGVLLVFAAFFGGYAMLDMVRGNDYTIPAVLCAGAAGIMLLITVVLLFIQAVVGVFVSPELLFVTVVFVSIFVLMGEFLAYLLPETETTEE